MSAARTVTPISPDTPATPRWGGCAAGPVPAIRPEQPVRLLQLFNVLRRLQVVGNELGHVRDALVGGIHAPPEDRHGERDREHPAGLREGVVERAPGAI